MSIEKVWKYDVPMDSQLIPLEMPLGSKILHLDTQRDVPRIWVQCPDFPSRERRVFVWVPTGGEVPERGQHVGTVLLMGAALVFHLYEVPTDARQADHR
jgi:hypothetical protein